MDGWTIVILLIAAGMLWWSIKTPASGSLTTQISSAITNTATNTIKSAGKSVVNTEVNSTKQLTGLAPLPSNSLAGKALHYLNDVNPIYYATHG